MKWLVETKVFWHAWFEVGSFDDEGQAALYAAAVALERNSVVRVRRLVPRNLRPASVKDWFPGRRKA